MIKRSCDVSKKFTFRPEPTLLLRVTRRPHGYPTRCRTLIMGVTKTARVGLRQTRKGIQTKTVMVMS
ncbi:UNVERIFIED_CONTAM: hypothetical protein FKN15_022141 [Acipenser sinensis]